MKTVCVAVIVLSLISVCTPASLECQKMLKPVDKDKDVLGRWYFIGISSTYCWAQTIFNSLFAPSLFLDIAPTERQHYYNITANIKLYGFCENDTFQMFYADNSIFDIDDQNNLQMEGKGMMLQSGCQDCLVISGENATEVIALLSRRPVVTADEMKEFEAQARCMSLYKPQIFSSDHDLGTCGMSDLESSDLSPIIRKRVENMFIQLFTCSTDAVFYYPQAAFKWIQESWASFW